ncbi:hypothetical protein BT63DRAFT_430324 [Microthyrium microscopicum]|uniref:PH domain-containing protein n=1 Tax=Microthyrium microscopicum TaxID=703497 RepID=A0A6A6TTT7_9PEZI|nr:hypothetical protein BT63DRAFT_430324 [Microthyrium microscopicum]
MMHSHSSYDPSTRLASSNIGRSNSLALNEDALNADYSNLSSKPAPTSPLAQSFDMQRGDSRGPIQDEVTLAERISRMSHKEESEDPSIMRSTSRASVASNVSGVSGVSRNNTLKKKKSLSRKSSLKRSSSKRSVRAGSIGGVTYDDTSGDDNRSVFFTPVPTTGSPTDILAARFQGWRKVLKDLIMYFREVQSTYEARAKTATKISHTVNSLAMPVGFLPAGGIGDAHEIWQQFHKQAVAENLKAKEIDRDVISQLNSLRADLQSKIKEIKSLSGDFKNSIEKEKEHTKKVVSTLQESLAAVDTEAKVMAGKDDPYIIRLSVDRQVERLVDEENYLHRAYLNIEGSGRELEAIVVGEIQKAHRAFATILKKEADEAYETVDRLQNGPLSLPKDAEWVDFILKDPHFINPDTPLRRAQDLEYPGKYHPASAEVRAGMLERKSKYLKSYTPGWFVLSPTHLHEFKSADSVYTQQPIMSLYLLDQKLGAHSQPDSSSHKFILKGRQTGGMHRGHSWVFRAESYDTMLAWYDDIKSLTEKTGEERNDFVRRHTRSFSNQSTKSVSSFDDDEADQIPFSANTLLMSGANGDALPKAGQISNSDRPQGGRFPSDVQLSQDRLHQRLTPSSDGSEPEEMKFLGTERDVPLRNSDLRHIDGDSGYGDSAAGVAQLRSVDQSYVSQRPAAGASWHASHKGPSHETPPPVENPLLQAHQAEYLTTSPGLTEHPSGAFDSNTTSAPDKAYFAAVTATHDHASDPLRSRALPASVIAAPSAGSAIHDDQSTGVPGQTDSVSHTQAPVVEQLPSRGMVRNNTDQSVSNLHVPGEYPRGSYP